VLQHGRAQFLALEPQMDTQTVAEGEFVIRYGIRYLGRGHLSIVPGLVVLDYGDMLTGDDAWNFLIKRSNLYPRSEVVGYRNDGADDMTFIRNLDLALPPQVLVYSDRTATVPLARPTALIADLRAPVPARLLDYLPRYESLAAWKAESTE
jgi:hypothetical protein